MAGLSEPVDALPGKIKEGLPALRVENRAVHDAARCPNDDFTLGKMPV